MKSLMTDPLAAASSLNFLISLFVTLFDIRWCFYLKRKWQGEYRFLFRSFIYILVALVACLGSSVVTYHGGEGAE